MNAPVTIETELSLYLVTMGGQTKLLTTWRKPLILCMYSISWRFYIFFLSDMLRKTLEKK